MRCGGLCSRAEQEFESDVAALGAAGRGERSRCRSAEGSRSLVSSKFPSGCPCEKSSTNSAEGWRPAPVSKRCRSADRWAACSRNRNWTFRSATTRFQTRGRSWATVASSFTTRTRTWWSSRATSWSLRRTSPAANVRLAGSARGPRSDWRASSRGCPRTRRSSGRSRRRR